jgi:uncharacterized protein YjeT (DUF2065 family)
MIAEMVVILSGFYFVLLAGFAVFRPDPARRFLNSFAQSARMHYLEMTIRTVVGTAYVAASPSLKYAQVFWWFGWVLILTSALLFLVPWQWHRRFAQIVVPPLTRFVWVFGIVSLPLGLAILWAVGATWSTASAPAHLP